MLISTLMLGVLVAALVQPPTLSYHDLPLRVEGSKIIYQGQAVPLKVHRCNSLNRQLIYTVTRTLKNIETQQTIVFESKKVSLEPGCHIDISMVHEIPINLPPGIYKAAGVGTVQGPFNDIDVPFYSEPFTVKAK